MIFAAQVSYKLTLSEDFLIKTFGQEVEAEIFHVGDYINVEDEELGINKIWNAPDVAEGNTIPFSSVKRLSMKVRVAWSYLCTSNS